MSLPAARKVAFQVREEFEAAGVEYTQEQEFARIKERTRHLAASAHDGMVRAAWEAVEDANRRRDQEEVIQRVLFRMEGSYALGDNRRIAKRYAHLDHYQQHLAIHDATTQAQIEANMREHDEAERLIPYWKPGMTKEEAVEAYVADHPEDDDDDDPAA
jgi:hypothetical protein